MLRATLLTITVLLTLSGCARLSDSQLNPLNWFGNSTQAPVTSAGDRLTLIPAGRATVIIDGRSMVQSITSLSIDRSSSGAIVRAVGVAPTQGYFNAELVNRGVTNGVLTLEFRAQRPNGIEVSGSDRSRQINVAYPLDASELSAIQSVRVEAATNARTSRR